MNETTVNRDKTTTEIIIFDVDGLEGRGIVETVIGTDLEASRVATFDEFSETLSSKQAFVGLVAFESLFPDPQKVLKKLRESTSGTRLIVVYCDGSPRLRLGQRLWSIGLFDYFVARSTPPHELRPMIRQAYADALIERSTETLDDADRTDSSQLQRHLRFIHGLQGAFTNQRRVNGLLRELQMKIPHFIDYLVMEVLVVGEGKPKLHVFQTRPVEHQAVWNLSERVCAAIAPLSDRALRPEDLFFEVSDPFTPGQSDDEDDSPTITKDSVITLPLLLFGELIGCLAFLVNKPEQLSGEHRLVLRLISYTLATSLRNAQILEAAEQATFIDELTGAYNRRYLRQVLEDEWRRAKRYDLQLSIAMIDIDNFKQINDLHGHLIGDSILRGLSEFIREHLRETDHLVRYGGEEFLLLLPETGPSEAMTVVERIRQHLGRQPLYTGELGNLHVTFSAGVSSFVSSKTASPGEVIELADRALFAAKRAGKDRVCLGTTDGITDMSSHRERNVQEDKRRHPRIQSRMRVRYIDLPEFAARLVETESYNLSAGGIALIGPDQHIRKNGHALLYLQEGDKPVLAQVMWTRDHDGGKREAGLRFVRSVDLISDQPITTSSTDVLRALVITNRPRTRSLVSRVLKAAQYEARYIENQEQLAQAQLEQYGLVVIGEGSLRSVLGESLPILRKRMNPLVRVVVINETSDRRQAIDTIRAQHVQHLVDAENASEEILFATLNKLLLGQYFGIKKYLLWGADPKAWTLTTSREKRIVLDGIRQVALSVHCHPRIMDLLVAAVDEMIINALYRPVESGGKAGKPITVECGSDGRLLAVAVLDEYGLFREEDMFHGLGQALIHEKEGLGETATQANLGFRIMLTALSQLAVNVDPGRCTEIIGIVDLRKTLRDYRQAVPGIGLFTK